MSWGFYSLALFLRGTWDRRGPQQMAQEGPLLYESLVWILITAPLAPPHHVPLGLALGFSASCPHLCR